MSESAEKAGHRSNPEGTDTKVVTSPGSGPFAHLVDGLLDDNGPPPASDDPFEATTVGESKEAVRRSVDHYVSLEPEGDEGFAGVLIDCWRERRTGVLRAEWRRGVTSVFFDEGNPVFAESTDPNGFFGRMLVDTGRLSDADLQRAINACGSRGGRIDPLRFGEVLVESKLLDPGAVYELMLLHACETLLGCFALEEFRARFGPERAAPIKFPFSTISMVREGVARCYGQQRVDRIVAPWVNRRARLRHNIDTALEQLGLTPEEHSFLLALDGRECLGVASQKSKLAPLETTKLVAVLILLDLLDLAPSNEPTETVKPRKLSPE